MENVHLFQFATHRSRMRRHVSIRFSVMDCSKIGSVGIQVGTNCVSKSESNILNRIIRWLGTTCGPACQPKTVAIFPKRAMLSKQVQQTWELRLCFFNRFWKYSVCFMVCMIILRIIMGPSLCFEVQKMLKGIGIELKGDDKNLVGKQLLKKVQIW